MRRIIDVLIRNREFALDVLSVLFIFSAIAAVPASVAVVLMKTNAGSGGDSAEIVKTRFCVDGKRAYHIYVKGLKHSTGYYFTNEPCDEKRKR